MEPSAAMLAPVRALAAFMSTLPSAPPQGLFARRGVTVVENFPPFIFAGPDAVKAWAAGFRAHAAAGGLAGLKASFGPARDLRILGARAYFALPTTWTGRSLAGSFREEGVWSFVLERRGRRWQILGYGWGVRTYRVRTRS